MKSVKDLSKEAWELALEDSGEIALFLYRRHLASTPKEEHTQEHLAPRGLLAAAVCFMVNAYVLNMNGKQIANALETAEGVAIDLCQGMGAKRGQAGDLSSLDAALQELLNPSSSA